MSFKFNPISSKVYLNVGQKNIFDAVAHVTPAGYAKKYPTDIQDDDGHCVLPNRSYIC